MHDIRFIRENPEAFDAALAKRGAQPVAAQLLEADEVRRAANEGEEGAPAVADGCQIAEVDDNEAAGPAEDQAAAPAAADPVADAPAVDEPAADE